ncbi:MAG TPA: DUF1146 domain-containing protein [Erysipelothrix sp.]|jgi:uncharacterized integral membrane protein (TIGR02327 family)|nr:DUF1146 domain-containing protein [Erysipelothrix sp.]
MNQAEIIRIALLFLSFFASYWAILGIDFERFIRKGKTSQAQILAVLLAMAMAYLVMQFILSLQLFI